MPMTLNGSERLWRRRWTTRKSIPAHRQHEALAWAVAQSEREMMDDALQPPRAPYKGREHVAREALTEDPAFAAHHVVPEAADAH
jgi:hypothetical protein